VAFVVLHGYLSVVIRCLLNLDEAVMSRALLVLHELLTRERYAKSIIIKKRGLPILSDCLADYKYLPPLLRPVAL
jgi:hypothetical protein